MLRRSMYVGAVCIGAVVACSCSLASNSSRRGKSPCRPIAVGVNSPFHAVGGAVPWVPLHTALFMTDRLLAANGVVTLGPTTDANA